MRAPERPPLPHLDRFRLPNAGNPCPICTPVHYRPNTGSSPRDNTNVCVYICVYVCAWRDLGWAIHSLRNAYLVRRPLPGWLPPDLMPGIDRLCVMVPPLFQPIATSSRAPRGMLLQVSSGVMNRNSSGREYVVHVTLIIRAGGVLSAYQVDCAKRHPSFVVNRGRPESRNDRFQIQGAVDRT
ncbi:uncharacterized protein B0I36DRAFT_113381 [Microdochium trichocladiopsis]|uniref:Uncharacterized protein n=1 Tax=Microdochium trichocladiopsis TaxID=1682393 RepID=A0A9P9BQA4_9PEZI|nr:uncharacterized protein B0I36DRAFT_113381 [Microdochium trichocladiopsis]KAH7030737.1 hypothetical protein B0I36DRAFT_113381 [Microdochium trichocladiopsis]